MAPVEIDDVSGRHFAHARRQRKVFRFAYGMEMVRHHRPGINIHGTVERQRRQTFQETCPVDVVPKNPFSFKANSHTMMQNAGASNLKSPKIRRIEGGKVRAVHAPDVFREGPQGRVRPGDGSHASFGARRTKAEPSSRFHPFLQLDRFPKPSPSKSSRPRSRIRPRDGPARSGSIRSPRTRCPAHIQYTHILRIGPPFRRRCWPWHFVFAVGPRVFFCACLFSARICFRKWLHRVLWPLCTGRGSVLKAFPRRRVGTSQHRLFCKTPKLLMAAKAVATARPVPHFMRIQSWWARIAPAAKRFSCMGRPEASTGRK